MATWRDKLKPVPEVQESVATGTEASWLDKLKPLPPESDFRNIPGPVSAGDRWVVQNVLYKPESQENYLREQGYEVRRRQDPRVQGNRLQPSGELEYRSPGDPQGTWYPLDPSGGHGLGETVQDVTDLTSEAVKAIAAQYGGGLLRAGGPFLRTISKVPGMGRVANWGQKGYGIIRQAAGAAAGQGAGETVRQAAGTMAGQPEFDPTRIADETITTGVVSGGMGAIGTLAAHSGAGVPQEAIRMAMDRPSTMGRPFGRGPQPGESAENLRNIAASVGQQKTIKTPGRVEMENILEANPTVDVRVLPTVNRTINAMGGRHRIAYIRKAHERVSRDIDFDLGSPQRNYVVERVEKVPRKNEIKVIGGPRAMESANQSAQTRLDKLARTVQAEADEHGRIPLARAEEILREQYRQPIAEKFDQEGGGAFVQALLKEQHAFREDIVKSLPRQHQEPYRIASEAASRDILIRDIVDNLFDVGTKTKPKLGNINRLKNVWNDADIGGEFRKAIKDYDSTYGTKFYDDINTLAQKNEWSPNESKTYDHIGVLMVSNYRNSLQTLIRMSSKLPIGLARTAASMVASAFPETGQVVREGVKSAYESAKPYIRLRRSTEEE